MINENDLRRRGIRLTPQRRMILDAIAQSSGHVTADEIYDHIVALYPDMNISTVYRNLERLLALHLIAVTDLGGGCLRYEALGSARHHHLICHKCGAITDFDDDLLAGLRAGIEERHHFLAGIDHLAIWGLCSSCRDDPQEGNDAHP